MNLEVHILTSQWNWILPWTLRHYCSFASKVVVHDGGPDFSETSANRELCRAHGAAWEMWDTAGQLNDALAMHLKNEAWKGTKADWVAVVDDDELLYFPPVTVEGMGKSEPANVLAAYSIMGAAMIRPEGFEMFSETLPVPGEHAQIWEAIRDGAPDEKWYSKPALFNPRLVVETGFGLGAHEARPVLKDGRALKVGLEWPHPSPRCLLLHYHQIGPYDFVAERYDATLARFCALNHRNGWGNHTPGAIHVQQKRDLIVPNLRRVVE